MTVRNFHPELLPKWLWPGTPVRRKLVNARRVEPLHINGPTGRYRMDDPERENDGHSRGA